MGLPNPSMSFTPFDPLPASDLNDMVENIEALADGSGHDDSSIADVSLLNGKIKGRVGGSASVWGTAGTTTYDTDGVNTLIQVGESTGSAAGTVSVTFQTAFSQNPIIVGSQQGNISTRAIFSVDSSTASGFAFSMIKQSDGTRYAGTCGWIAIGPA